MTDGYTPTVSIPALTAAVRSQDCCDNVLAVNNVHVPDSRRKGNVIGAGIPSSILHPHGRIPDMRLLHWLLLVKK